LKTGKSILHYFAASEKEKDKYREEMRPLAKKYRDFLHFTITDTGDFPEVPSLLGLKKGSKTGLSLQNPNNGEVFPYKGKKKLTPDVVETFLDDVIDGRIKPWEGSPTNQFGGGGFTHEEL
jgi:protein disulfide-isomerase A1